MVVRSRSKRRRRVIRRPSRIGDALLAHVAEHDKTHAKPLTRTQLAQKIGIDFTTLMRLLSGKVRSPKSETLQKLSKALGLSADHLLGLE